MATARNYQDSDSDVSDPDYSNDSEDDNFIEVPEPCRFYNKGFCRNGARCTYLHVCKFALRGSCRNGSNCHLSHDIATGGRRRSDTQTQGPTLTDGRFYQWQLCNGNSWMDIENDHVIEAQYSLPNIKSLKLYNMRDYGSVCIDFKRMRVKEKSFKVRRLDDGNTEWIWYVILHGKWTKYGEQGSTANPSPVNSCDIEQAFCANPRGLFTFDVKGETLKIDFKKMQQFSRQTTRKVARRPFLKVKPGNAQIPQATSTQRLSNRQRAQWQFEGNNGNWYEFKCKSGTSNVCSVNSNDIEAAYQRNPTGSMPFKVSGQDYKLNFAAMKQINTVTGNTRNIRRMQL